MSFPYTPLVEISANLSPVSDSPTRPKLVVLSKCRRHSIATICPPRTNCLLRRVCAHSPSQRHRPYSNSDPRSRRPSHSHPAQYVHGHGPVQLAPVLMYYPSQSQPRGLSTSSGPQVAEFHFNPAMAYPSHSHSDPRHTHTKSILRNMGGVPLVSVVPPQHTLARRKSVSHPPPLQPDEFNLTQWRPYA